MALLEAHNINKYFKTPTLFHALKDINFSIDFGEFVSVMGKSGCGKSTLLYILSTLDTEYDGELIIDGTSLVGKNQNFLSQFRNEHIGFVFQFHYLLPHFTVLQNVMLPAQKLGKKSHKEIEESALAKLELLDVAEQAHKQSNLLSGGQQQRVAIARALINEPQIIMGDEPTGNLDSKNGSKVLDIFAKLAEDNGQSIIMVTHDEDFAKRTHRTITMGDGRVINEGC